MKSSRIRALEVKATNQITALLPEILAEIKALRNEVTELKDALAVKSKAGRSRKTSEG